MAAFNAQPIRRQVLVTACVLFVPLVAVAVYSASRTKHEREAEVRQEAAAAAVAAAASIEQYFAGLDALAAGLVRHPVVRALDRAACDALFADLLPAQTMVLNVVLLDADGNLRGSGLPTAYVTHESTQWPIVAQVVASGRPALAEAPAVPANGTLTTTLAYPVRGADGRVAGVLAIGVNLFHLQTLLGGIPLSPGSSVTLADRRNRVLACLPDEARFRGAAIESRPAEPGDVPASVERAGIDGVVRFYGNAVVDRPGWLLSVGIPVTVALERAAPLFRRNLIIALSGAGTMLVLSLWVSTLLSAGLNRLRAATRRIAGGDLTPPVRTVEPNLELAQLQDAFVTMASNLRETRVALNQRVEQERRMRETLQSLQRQVVRQERLAAVGVLVSGVAHELNNPLQAILGTAELLERRGLAADVLEEIAFLKTQSGRAREIIRNLSRFSSQQSGPPALVDLREVIAEVVQLRQGDLSNSSITLEVDTTTTRLVYANFTEIEQVVLNFVINAQQSIEAAERSNGRIRIVAFDEGRKVRLEVQDDGPGVSVEDEPKLFQPFFTTKPVGQGTGLGLSVSYGIVDSYSGAIGYRSSAWGGASFFFELPAADPAQHPRPTAADTSTHTDDSPAVLHRPVSPGV